ncbi:hypothetical protein BH11BAC1_BH11BAC1_28010 [soil metagenome]
MSEETTNSNATAVDPSLKAMRISMAIMANNAVQVNEKLKNKKFTIRQMCKAMNISLSACEITMRNLGNYFFADKFRTHEKELEYQILLDPAVRIERLNEYKDAREMEYLKEIKVCNEMLLVIQEDIKIVSDGPTQTTQEVSGVQNKNPETGNGVTSGSAKDSSSEAAQRTSDNG